MDVDDAANDAEATLARSTRQRRAVEESLDGLEGFRSARDLHALITARGGAVGLATVYRTLQLLVDRGVVDTVMTHSGEAVYRRCSRTHHHHLVCRACGRTVEIEGPAVEDWTVGVAERHGYVDVGHTIELFGLCGSCSRTASGTPTC